MERLELVVEASSTRRSRSSTTCTCPTCSRSARFYKDCGLLSAAASRARTCSTTAIPRHRQRRLEQEPAACRAARSSTATERRSCRSTCATRSRSRSSSPHSGTSMPTRPRVCIPSTASPSRTTCSAQDTKGTKTAHRGARRERQVLVDQVAALARPRHGGRAAGALRHRLRLGQRRVQGPGRHGAEEARRAADRRCSRRSDAPRRAASSARGRRTRCATSTTS